MKNILYLDACIREGSRTKRLAEKFMASLKSSEDISVNRIEIAKLDIAPLTAERLKKKNSDELAGTFSDPWYDLAKGFAAADRIVIAAPYWDASFPAKLKVYIENITISTLTFKYDQDGRPVKLINADKLVYISTSGGLINDNNSLKLYLKELFYMFAVDDVEFYCAQGLDFMLDKVDEILDREYAKMLGDGSNII